jgi:ABC-type transport system substrate-binding protein
LAANAYAWRKPHLQRVLLRVMPDQSTLLVGLQTNEIDVAALTEEQIPLAQQIPGMRIVRTRQNNTTYVEYQTQRPPMNDPLVRRALLEAVDREHILATVFLGYQTAATTEIPPIFAAHDASIPARRYDPKAAAADLEAAGWHLRDGVRSKGGKSMDLLFAYVSTSAQARRMAVIYQEDLARVGINLEVKGYPATVFYGGGDGIEHSGKFDLAATYWYGGSDPEESEFFTCANLPPAGPNTSFWCNHTYDALYARQMIEGNPAARLAIFKTMQHVVRDGALGDFLVNTTGYTAASARVRAWAPNMLFNYGNSQDWDVAP